MALLHDTTSVGALDAYVITHVTKRDGTLQNFTLDRVQRAALGALLETGQGGEQEALRVAHGVAAVLNTEAKTAGGENYTPSVEHIQDVVEQELMRQGLYETARAFIVYRERRAGERVQKKEELLVHIASSNLSVILRSGIIARFDMAQIYRFVEQCAEGYGAIDVAGVVNDLKNNIFDGISVPEINEAIVMAAKARIEQDPSYSFFAARVLVNELYKRVIGFNEFDEDFVQQHRTVFQQTIARGIQEGRLDGRMANFDFEKLGDALDYHRDHLFEYRGLRVLWDRYLIRDHEQNFMETPQYFWMRVAMGMSFLEDNPTEKAIASYHMISCMKYVPSSPSLIHSGQPKAQMSACYLNYVSDDLAHIFKVMGDNAQMSKWSGGIGTDWTSVRATNALVKSINQTSQGLIPFLKIADSTTAAINRSGKRRGAAAVYLENWHMDFEYFLDLRKNTGDDRRRTHDINTVAWVPDLFMKRVHEGGMWTFFSPEEVPDLHDLYGKKFEERYMEYEKMVDEGKINLFKRVEASTLWRKMITMLFETGHPWITFKDPCNIRSPQDHVGVIHNSNLCTEITLNTSVEETAVCNLGSIALQRHMDETGNMHWESLAETIHMAMRMIDNVIDLNYYPTIEGRTSNMRHRPVGLGIMGYQDVLFKKRVPFDSSEAVELSDEIMEFVSYHAILSSSELAKEKGTYESYPGSKWDRGLLPQDTIVLLEAERGIPTGMSPMGKLDWVPVREHIKDHGMRNSNCMAIAPTATIGNISGSLPSIEPIYKNIYVKSNFSGDFTVVNDALVNDLKGLGIWNGHMLDMLKQYDGSIQNIAGIPEELKSLYKEVFEMDPHWIIKHAARRQKWLDQSQSVNIFTRTTSGKAISDIYFDAWRSGLKTTYYLRTLGASSIEKATVTMQESPTSSASIASSSMSEVSSMSDMSISAPPVVQPVLDPAFQASFPDSAHAIARPLGTKQLHVYQDLTCESCQ